MQPVLKLPPATGLDQELNRVHQILSGLSDALVYQPPSSEQDPGAQITTDATDEFDWSATLGNIDELIRARDAATAKLHAAEVRAERAEARAAEAEQWLRRLHEAVLKGLPTHQS